MTPDPDRSTRIARDQAESLMAHLDTVVAQLERQVTALEGAAAEPGCRTAARLLADATQRRRELSEARSHRDALRVVAERS